MELTLLVGLALGRIRVDFLWFVHPGDSGPIGIFSLVAIVVLMILGISTSDMKPGILRAALITVASAGAVVIYLVMAFVARLLIA